MAYFNISLLPSAVSLSGSEQLLGQQSGNTVAITVAQIASLSVQAAAGSNTQVQYNSTGLLAGNAAFTFNSASGTLSITNVSSSGAISAGTVSANTAVFTTLSATGATVNFNGAGQAISLAPTGAGSVTINPATAGSINNMAIGATTQAAGNFTIVNVTGSTVPANGIYLSAANTTSFSSNSTIRGTINSTGTWAINATSSANASLTVAANGATSAIAAQITNSAGNAAYLEALGNGATSGTNGVKIGMDPAGSGAFISEGSTTVYLGTNGSPRLTISGAGAISIPNSSTFTVNTTGGSGLSILAASTQVANLFIAGNGDTSAQGLQISHSTSGAQIFTQSSDPIIIGTNNTQRIYITSTGILSLYNGAAGWTQLAGWGAPTGAVVVSNFPGATATLLQCSQALAYVIGCLKALGALAA